MNLDPNIVCQGLQEFGNVMFPGLVGKPYAPLLILLLLLLQPFYTHQTSHFIEY